MATAIGAVSGGDWDTLRRRGREHAARHTWSVVADQQSTLYADALRCGAPRARGHDRRADRAAALARFGPTAQVPGGRRPFALPLLRANGPLTRSAGRLLDALR